LLHNSTLQLQLPIHTHSHSLITIHIPIHTHSHSLITIHIHRYLMTDTLFTKNRKSQKSPFPIGHNSRTVRHDSLSRGASGQLPSAPASQAGARGRPRLLLLPSNQAQGAGTYWPLAMVPPVGIWEVGESHRAWHTSTRWPLPTAGRAQAPHSAEWEFVS
jgi:hypothetical protein